jgi:hypothetical protein
MRIGGGVNGDTASSATELANENLAFWSREPCGVACKGVEKTVSQLRKIVRLPIVVGPGCEQRVERGLPGREGLHANYVGDRVSQRAERLQCALTVGFLACIADGEDEDFLSVNLSRKEGQRWSLSEDHPDRQFVRGFGGDLAITCKKLLCAFKGMDNEPGQNHWTDGM